MEESEKKNWMLLVIIKISNMRKLKKIKCRKLNTESGIYEETRYFYYIYLQCILMYKNGFIKVIYHLVINMNTPLCKRFIASNWYRT